MLVLSPSAEAGPLVVSSAPIPITTNPKLVNQLSIKPRLGQWSKVLAGGPSLHTGETNAIAVLYPVPNGGQADAFVIQDQGGPKHHRPQPNVCLRHDFRRHTHGGDVRIRNHMKRRELFKQILAVGWPLPPSARWRHKLPALTGPPAARAAHNWLRFSPANSIRRAVSMACGRLPMCHSSLPVYASR